MKCLWSCQILSAVLNYSFELRPISFLAKKLVNLIAMLTANKVSDNRVLSHLIVLHFLNFGSGVLLNVGCTLMQQDQVTRVPFDDWNRRM